MIILIISMLSNSFTFYKPQKNLKKEIISSIIHTQYQSLINHESNHFVHKNIGEPIWFNTSGNVNQANTICIDGSKQSFTIMLHTGRIHE